MRVKCVLGARIALSLLATPARAALDDNPFEPFNRAMLAFNKALVRRMVPARTSKATRILPIVAGQER